MVEPVMLDSGPLGRLAHLNAPTEITVWVRSLLVAKRQVIIPEIADYEVRRGLLLHGRQNSLAILDGFQKAFAYQPITTSVMLRAAGLWADARRRGRPTADPKELDGDVILAAMALEVGAIIATENVGHLSRYVTAKHWRQIGPRP
jgi:predicted nucleic acid-binding protein